MADTLEQILAELKKINQTTKTNQDATKETNEQLKTSADLLEQQNKQYEEINKQIEAELKLQNELTQQLQDADEEQTKLIKEKIKFSKEYTRSLKNQTKESEKFAKTFGKVKQVFGAVTKAAQKYNQTITKTTGIDFTQIFSYDSAREAALSLDELGKSILKVGGISGDFRKDIEQTQKSMQEFGVTNQDVADSTIMLINSMSRFTLASSEQRAALRRTVLQLQKAKNAGAEAATSMDLLTTVFGESNNEVDMLTKQMAASGEAMGIPPQKMLAAFAAAAPRLAVLGGDIQREFMRMSATAKVTGAEFSSLIQISQGFDTFEEAAKRTSQLNAMFGTQLNSVELLRMESDEQRIAFIKNQLMMQGQTIESIGKFGRLSLSRILGTDVKTLRQAFRDVGKEIDETARKGEEADVSAYQKQLNTAITIRETLQSTINSLKNMIGEALVPALEGVSKNLMNKDFQTSMKNTADYLGSIYSTITKAGSMAAQAGGAGIAAAAGTKEAIDMTVGPTVSLIGDVISALGLAGFGGQLYNFIDRVKNGRTKTPSSPGGPKPRMGPSMPKGPKPPIPRIPAPSLGVLGSTVLPILALGAAALGMQEFAEYMENQVDTIALSKGLRGPITLEEMGLQPLPGEQIGSGGVSLPPVSLQRDPSMPYVPPMLARAPATPTVPTTTTTTSKEGVSTMATQIAAEVAKSFNPVINMTAYVGDKQTTVRLVKDALNSSYPLGRATNGG
jgi:hypothetical protein